MLSHFLLHQRQDRASVVRGRSVGHKHLILTELGGVGFGRFLRRLFSRTAFGLRSHASPESIQKDLPISLTPVDKAEWGGFTVTDPPWATALIARTVRTGSICPLAGRTKQD